MSDSDSRHGARGVEALRRTMTVEALRRTMTPFAASILAKVRGLKDLYELSDCLQQRLRESISDDIKKATNFHPHHQSVAAQREALARGIVLAGKTWHDQPKFDPKRRLFVVEHKVTVRTLRERCINAKDETAILDVLVNDLCVVWVLREEDDRLTRLGFRIHRPDPNLAYHKAGIDVVATT